jgi:nicotinamidase-related amidase
MLTTERVHDLVKKDSLDLYTHFLKKNDKNGVLVSRPEQSDSNSLFVIDMQNDFVLPEGRFSVADGITMANDLAEFIERCLNNPTFTKVIFSRDTHDVEHCSFFTNDGPFPPHCIVNHKGADMHKSMKEFGNEEVLKENGWDKKIRVIFKGCDEKTDSFGAVEYTDDKYSESRQLGNKCTLNTGKTGGRYFKGSEKSFNEQTFRKAPFLKIGTCDNRTSDTIGAPNYYPNITLCPKSKFTEEHQDEYLGKQLELEDLLDRKKNNSGKDLVHNIYVTGLAGDYCVKDTAINIMKSLQTKPVSGYKINVYVVHPFVRFPLLPLHLAGGISQVYKGKNISKNNDTNLFTITEKGVKDVNKYIFKKTGEHIIPLKKEEVQTLKGRVDAGESVKDINTTFEYWAFLTPTKDIINDYAKVGVKILTEVPSVGAYGGARTRSQRRRNNRTHKRK